MTERVAMADMIDSALANEPMDAIDANEPIDPMESTLPTEPIERIELRLPMLKIESCDRHDHLELPAPATCAPYPPHPTRVALTSTRCSRRLAAPPDRETT